MISVLDHPLVSHNLSIIRRTGASVQDYRSAFRRIAFCLAYESARVLGFEEVSECEPDNCRDVLTQRIMLLPLLRSGLPLLEPFTQLLPQAAVGFAGFMSSEQNIENDEYYFSLPSITDNMSVFILSSAIGSGAPICSTLARLQLEGAESLCVVSIAISESAAEKIRTEFPTVRIIAASIDSATEDSGLGSSAIGSIAEKFYGGYSI